MSNQLVKVFENKELGNIRVISKDGEPWFVLADVCKMLEIKNNPQLADRLNSNGVSKTYTMENSGFGERKIELNIINEPNLYKCVIRSNKPEAEKFQDWICEEVIPSIRKHGMYATDELLANPDLFIQVLTQLKEEKEQKRIALLERDIAISTKAEIGSRREATSMQTASVAVRKVNKLSDQINKLTDNEKRPDEYTTFEAARHIGVFSVDYKGIVKKPHMMLVASIFNTLKDTDSYGRKVKSDINGHIVDTIYVNDLFVEEASDFIRKYESEGCITLKGRDYKFRLVR